MVELEGLHRSEVELTAEEVGPASIILVGFSAVIILLLLTTAWRTWSVRGPLEAGLRVPWEFFARFRPTA